MGRLLCIDYGRRRCGIAATDPLRIIATGITTVPTAELLPFIKDYISREQVDAIVIGRPVTLQGEPSESMRYITPAVGRIRNELPDMPIIFWDERFTSTIAHRAMLDGGMKKQDRRNKAVVDKIAATIILNDYLQSRAHAQSL
jgi:putative Holliday junction resolvase